MSNKCKLQFKCGTHEINGPIVDLPITIGCNSIVASMDEGLRIGNVCGYDCCEDGIAKLTIVYFIVPNKRVVHGVIRITDNDDQNCYSDIEVFINQENGIWPNESYYIQRILDTDKCCTPYNETSFNVSVGNWIKTLKATIYDVDYIDAVCNDVVDNETEVILKMAKCRNLDDMPIILSGYDENGILVEYITVYLTLKYEKGASDNQGNDLDILQVTPSEILIPYGVYNNFNELTNANLGFTYSAYSNNPSHVLQINSTNVDGFTSNQIYSNFYGLISNEVISQTDFNNTSANMLMGMSGQTLSQTITFALGSKTKTVNVVLYGQPYVSQNIVPRSITENGDEFEFNALNDTLKLYYYADECKGDDDWACVNYQSTMVITFQSNDWYIYQCDSSVFSCQKIGNALQFKLLDYTAVLQEDNKVAIILKNSYGNIYTIYYAVEDGLAPFNEYAMYWAAEEDTVFENAQYYTLDVHPLTMVSWMKTSANGYIKIYGDWSYEATSKTANVAYEIRQCIGGGKGNTATWSNPQRIFTLNETNLSLEEDSDFACNVWVTDDITKVAADMNVNDIWIRTNQTFTTKTESTITFYQINGEGLIELNITHDPVLIYRIYTDRDGSIMVNKK